MDGLELLLQVEWRIDFPKHGFDDAYHKLMIEIDRNRKEKKQESRTQHHEIPSTTKPPKETSVLKLNYETKK